MSDATQLPRKLSGGVSLGGVLMFMSALAAIASSFLPGIVFDAFEKELTEKVYRCPGGKSIAFAGIAGAVMGAMSLRRFRDPTNAEQRFAVPVAGMVLGLSMILNARELLAEQLPPFVKVETGVGCYVALGTAIVFTLASGIRAMEVRRK